MARRRTKKRAHPSAQNGPENKPTPASRSSREPKSMVIRIGAGEVGPSVSQLVKDVRSIMEPNTASRLRERRSNRLKDYVTMAGPLGVSHLLLFSKSTSGNTNLRLALTPRGPTLHFRVERYSLCKDIKKAQKHPKGTGKEYKTPPLLVMNNFVSPTTEAPTKTPHHLESMTTTIFQSLFPPISPQNTPLSSIHRVLLLNREVATKSDDEGSYIINVRHYAITTKSAGLSRPLRRLKAAEKLLHSQTSVKGRKGHLPDLGNLEDIADFMVGGEGGEGYMTDATSASEVDTDAEVEVLESATKKVLSSKARKRAAKDRVSDGAEKKAIKLVELGPRMKLRLTKVEEGVCGGKVMWHEYIHKSKEELQEMDNIWEQRRRDKEERKRVQRENVESKRKVKENGSKDVENGDDGGDEMDIDNWDSEEFEREDDMNGEWEDEDRISTK